MSLPTRIFIGLFLGIATGLLFGEMVAFLKPVGNVFVQLQGKELIRRSQLEGDEPESAVDFIVPASFNFPHAGKLLQLSFVLFAADHGKHRAHAGFQNVFTTPGRRQIKHWPS